MNPFPDPRAWRRPHAQMLSLLLLCGVFCVGRRASAAGRDEAPREVLELVQALMTTPGERILRARSARGDELVAYHKGLVWSSLGIGREFDTLVEVARTTRKGVQISYSMIADAPEGPRLQLTSFETHTPERLAYWGAGLSFTATRLRTRDGRDLVKLVRREHGRWISTVLADPATNTGLEYLADPAARGGQRVRRLERAIPFGLRAGHPELFAKARDATP